MAKKYRGLRTGMRLKDYYAFLFRCNERNIPKWTDKEILSKIEEEFRQYGLHPSLKDVAKERSDYNTGDSGEVPQTCSFKYSKDGEVLNSSDKPCSVRTIRNALLRHQDRYAKYIEQTISQTNR